MNEKELMKQWKKDSMRIGSPTNILAALTAFLPVIWLCTTYNCWPPVSTILTAWGMVAASFGAFYFVEPISYYAALGMTGTYLSFLSGNIGNMRVPCAALALDVTDKSGEIKSVNAKGSLDGVTSAKGLQMDWKLSLSDLSSLLGEDASDPIVQGIIAALSDLEGEVRVDMEKPAIYLTLPAVLSGGDENTWYALDLEAYQAQLLSGLDMTQLTRLEGAGIREILTTVLKSVPVNDSQTDYEALALMASLYVDMLSDQAFTRNGSKYTAKTVLDGLVELETTLTKKGDDVVSVDLKMTASAEEEGMKMDIAMTEHASPDKVDFAMDMTVSGDQADIIFHMDLNCLPTAKTPQTQPPKGVTVTPMA